MNIELFQKIDEVIHNEPDKHYQGYWESTNDCGTVRCVAGWAVHLATGAPVFDRYGDPTRETEALGRSVGVHDALQIAAIARRLLDITPEQASRLFFTNDRTARWIVHAVATGGEPDWRWVENSAPSGTEVE